MTTLPRSPAVNLRHVKSTVAEGRAVLLHLLLTVLGLGLFQWWLFPWIWRESRWFVLAFVAIEILVVAIGLGYAAINARRDRQFECYLDDERIVCDSPVPHCGDSFALSLEEIDKLEREAWGDGHRWYLWSKSGARHWLTANYDNPVDDFLNEIRRRRPGIPEITT